jgi:hypothetical protein
MGKSKFEEKLEAKDAELLNLKRQPDGYQVVELKVELA